MLLLLLIAQLLSYSAAVSDPAFIVNVKNTFLNIDEDLDHPLRRVKSDPCFPAFKENTEQMELITDLDSSDRKDESKGIFSEINKCETSIFHEDFVNPMKESAAFEEDAIKEVISKEKEDEAILETAIALAKSESGKLTKEFEQEVFVWFNSLLQQRFEFMEMVKKSIRNINDAMRRWNNLNWKKRNILRKHLSDEVSRIQTFRKQTSDKVHEKVDLGTRIATHLVYSATEEDPIFIKSSEVTAVTKEADTLQDSWTSLVFQFESHIGETKKLLERSIIYYGDMMKLLQNAFKILEIRKNVLKKAVDEWENANSLTRKWFRERNRILVDRMHDLKKKFDTLMIENKELLSHMNWYVYNCEKDSIDLDPELVVAQKKALEARTTFGIAVTEIEELEKTFLEIESKSKSNRD